MLKQEIINHYHEMNEWLQTLKKINETQWQMPIGEGKWSVAAVITHLLFWDRYSLKERFPLFLEGAKLEGFPDYQIINDSAKEYAEGSGMKDDIIEELLKIRLEFINLIEKYTEADLDISFTIGKHPLTIRDYFRDFVDHDSHHLKQIEVVLLLSSN